MFLLLYIRKNGGKHSNIWEKVEMAFVYVVCLDGQREGGSREGLFDGRLDIRKETIKEPLFYQPPGVDGAAGTPCLV